MSKRETNTETVLLPEDDLIPLAIVAIEIGESVDRTAHRFGEAVVLDDVGMRAVPASVAREYFTERAEWRARQAEDAQRRAEEAAQKKRVLAGVPAQEGASAFETMMASGDYVTPSDEFGRPSPAQEFMDEQFSEGQRRLAEAREKRRAADKLREDLR